MEVLARLADRNLRRSNAKPTYRHAGHLIHKLAVVSSDMEFVQSAIDFSSFQSFRSVPAQKLLSEARRLLLQTSMGRKLLRSHKLVMRNWKGSKYTADRSVWLKPL